MYGFPTFGTTPLSSVVALYFLLHTSSASPDHWAFCDSFLPTLSQFWSSCQPPLKSVDPFAILCPKSFSSSATRSIDLQEVFSPSFHNYQLHHYLNLQFGTFSAFFLLQSFTGLFLQLKCKHHESRTVPLFSFLSLTSPQMFAKLERKLGQEVTIISCTELLVFDQLDLLDLLRDI